MKKTNIIALIGSQLIFLALLPFMLHLMRYLNPAIFVVIWLIITVVMILFVYSIRKEKLTIKWMYWKWAYVLYSVCLLLLLFDRPYYSKVRQWNLTPFRTITFYFTGDVSFLVALYNLGANIGLFVPFGIFILVSIKKKTLFKLLGLPVIGISLIEGLQFLTARGTLDIDDLILNLSGVGIGYLLYPLFIRWVELKVPHK